MEWLYIEQCVAGGSGGNCNGNTMETSGYPEAQYPDLKEGRFLQLGHKVMWRIDITPDAGAAPIPRGDLQADGQLHGYQPFQLFDTCRDVSNSFQKTPPKTGKNCVQPIFYEPGIVYLGGAATPPALGVAFGTGDRSSLTRLNPTTTGPPPASEKNSFYYVIDGGSTASTLGRTDLIDLTPGGPVNPCVPYNPAICGMSAAERYRFSTLQGRYAILNERWDRLQGEKESGRRPGLYGHFGEAPPPRAAFSPDPNAGRAGSVNEERGAVSGESERELFDRYVAAKRAKGEDVSGYRLEGFLEGLERERRKVRDRLGEGDIVFDVAERDGRVRLVAKKKPKGSS